MLTACSTSRLSDGEFFGQHKPDSLALKCYEKPDPGFCRAYMPRYYYDSTEKKCKEFIYGGCQGNVPFETLEECQKTCKCDTIK